MIPRRLGHLSCGGTNLATVDLFREDGQIAAIWVGEFDDGSGQVFSFAHRGLTYQISLCVDGSSVVALGSGKILSCED